MNRSSVSPMISFWFCAFEELAGDSRVFNATVLICSIFSVESMLAALLLGLWLHFFSFQCQSWLYELLNLGFLVRFAPEVILA